MKQWVHKHLDDARTWLLTKLLTAKRDGLSQSTRDTLTRGETILSKLYTEVLIRNPQLIGRQERILRSMMSPDYLLMHSTLAKVLMLMEKQPQASLRALYDSGQLEGEAGKSFNRFLATTGFTQFSSGSKIRELFAAELFEGIGDISLPIGISNEASHHDNHMDMMFVVAIAKYRRARRLFEFGTYMGRTTCGLASIGDDVEVFTLNLPPDADERYGPYIGKFIESYPFKNRIRQLFGDSRNFDTRPYAKSMDYVFVDADHTYEGVKNDTTKAFELLAPGGIVVWHDYAPKSPGVYGYLGELSETHSLFRIKNTCIVLHMDGVNSSTFTPVQIEPHLEDMR